MRLPRQPGHPASPDVSAAQKALPLEPGLRAAKQITPPTPSLTDQLLPLYPLPGVQDANPLWPIRISNFPLLPPLQHPDPPKHLQSPRLLGVQDVSPHC